jgi:DNA (cytosine-5)-methyltransferase 1
VFHGSRSAQYKQIGNAVPPRLAQVIGAALHAALS